MTVSRFAPSTIAASSISTGTPCRIPRRTQMVKGSTNATYVSERQIRLLRRSRLRRLRNSGISSAGPGTIWIANIATRTARRPRNRNRVSAVAARNATTIENTTAAQVTIRLLRRSMPKYGLSTASAKLLRLSGNGRNFGVPVRICP